MSTIRATMTRRLLGEASGPLAGIYVVTHRTSGMRYVGQSVNIKKRWRVHLSGQSGSPRLTNALQKHGPEAFTFEIVELCAPEELTDRELFYISAFGFDSLSPRGYNLGAGGDGVDFTPEVRAKISVSTQQRYENEGTGYREKIEAANRRRADQTRYTLIHTKTGAVEQGLRYELCDRLRLDKPNLCDLISGKRKTHKGYRLARPEEIQ